MNNVFNKVKNIIISGVIAFIALTFFCCVYYNVPIHKQTKDGATDYSWEPYKNYSSMIEGYGKGKTNNEGYMNIYDYEDGMNIDVLVMGSSHLQGLQIDINDNCSTLLNSMLEDKNVYNIAIAGHNFKTCISNLENALNKYKPKIVVIETSRINLSNKEIEDTINDQIPEIKSNENPVIKFLQRNPLLRLLYNQYENYKSNTNDEEDTSSSQSDFCEKGTNNLLAYINDTCIAYDVKPIIIYHPTVSINKDEMIVNRDINVSNNFAKLCEMNSITFIDMSNRYIQEYENSNIVPTGFNNTGVAKGHINKYAHKMFAEELYKAIQEMYK